MARVAGKVRIVILPANPSRGRVIRAGNYFVEGRPLHETVFAHDPTHPRTTSRVAELLGDDLADVATPNAETMADMALCAAEVGDDTLPVGAADFFKALLARRTPPRVQATRAQQDCAPTFHAAGARAIPRSVLRIPPSPSVLVCGSAASWAQRVEAATAQGIPIFALPHDVAAAVAALRASHRLLMGIGHGSATHGRSPAELVGQLAVSVAAILHEARPARLLLEGGATTAAVMRALGWTRLRACEVSAQCVGVLRPADPAGPLLFIKPGSYPWPAEIWPG